MNGLLVAIAIFLTITLAVLAGIGLSYLAASSVLRAFAQRPAKRAALNTVEAGFGGD